MNTRFDYMVIFGKRNSSFVVKARVGHQLIAAVKFMRREKIPMQALTINGVQFDKAEVERAEARLNVAATGGYGGWAG